MKIRHVKIRNFRGIRELDWQIIQSHICLIGHGDSTKSTILDAIQLCLSPRWALSFTDADFFNCETANPIEITTTVGELPDTLICQEKFGDYLRGWSAETGLVDEPSDGTERVLSVALIVDESLEPKWTLINDREPKGIGISAYDRKKFGATSLGMYVDHHLSWGKNSALSQLTGNDEDVSSVLAEASRSAREAVANSTLSELNRSAEKASELAKVFGVLPHDQFTVGLDAKLSVTGQATLTLHDGQIPARMAGLGSRRLLTLAIQHESVPEGGILLIDEIEAGLEPHRLRHLIRKLRPSETSKQQVIMTTHSSVAIEEHSAHELHIVHNIDGKINILSTPNNLQSLVRKAAEAFLARKIIACEGSTEVGFIRKMDQYWQTEEGGQSTPFACLGVFPIALTGGAGSSMPRSAIQFSQLGYNVAYLGDSDVPLNPTEETMTETGISVLVWADSKSIEERICLDLPFDGLNDFISGAVESALDRGGPENSVYDAIGSEFNLDSGDFDGNIQTLVDLGQTEANIREAIGKQAKENTWYKRISYGEQLAGVVIKHFDSMAESNVAITLGALKEWANE